jgi:GxxExxY protein
MKMGSQRTSRELPPRGEEKPFKATAERVIAGIQEAHSSLRPGLLETVHEEALAHEFQLQGLRFLRPKEAKLSCKGMNIGWHRVDFLVEEEVVGELKSVEKIHGIQRGPTDGLSSIFGQEGGAAGQHEWGAVVRGNQ